MLNSSYAFDLIVAAKLYASYSTYGIIVAGLIGTLLNILVFTNLKIFRLNRCAFYLIVESIIDIGQLTHIFVNETWQISINGVEPVNISFVWCKLRTMLQEWCRLMLSSIVCFAAIDQFLSTNHVAYLRQLSSLKLARCQICFASLLCLVHTMPFGVFLEIRSLFGCIIINSILRNYYTFLFYPVLNGLLPICVSSLFSLLAYRNVRRIIRRHISIDRRRRDRQLTAMIFVRVIGYVILSIPYIIYRIYSLNVTINGTDLYQYAVNQLVSLMAISLMFVNHAASFYIFFGTSSRYRRQVRYVLMKKCWQSLKHCCRGPHNTVQPLDGILAPIGSELA